MAENIGRLPDNHPVEGVFTYGDKTIKHYMDLDFPVEVDGKTIAPACLQHIQEGVVGQLVTDYDLFGMHFPADDEPQVVRTAVVCPGTKNPKKCAVRVLQATLDGDVFAGMDVEGSSYTPQENAKKQGKRFGHVLMRLIGAYRPQ